MFYVLRFFIFPIFIFIFVLSTALFTCLVVARTS
jgi:hypothetical protein